MKNTLLACASALALLTACDPHYDNGYYDANGNYVASENVNNGAQRNQNNATWPGKPIGYYNDSNRYNNDPAVDHDNYYPRRNMHNTRVVTTDTDTYYLYERPGVYNLDGDYLGTAASYGVPSSLVPASGTCLVWFPHRTTYDQPQPQSCNGLIDHAPSGSYIVFGG